MYAKCDNYDVNRMIAMIIFFSFLAWTLTWLLQMCHSYFLDTIFIAHGCRLLHKGSPSKSCKKLPETSLCSLHFVGRSITLSSSPYHFFHFLIVIWTGLSTSTMALKSVWHKLNKCILLCSALQAELQRSTINSKQRLKMETNNKTYWNDMHVIMYRYSCKILKAVCCLLNRE